MEPVTSPAAPKNCSCMLMAATDQTGATQLMLQISAYFNAYIYLQQWHGACCMIKIVQLIAKLQCRDI